MNSLARHPQLIAAAFVALLFVGASGLTEVRAQRPGGGERGQHQREGRHGPWRRGYSREERARREALRERAVSAFDRLTQSESTQDLAKRFKGMARQSVYRIDGKELSRLEKIGDAELVRAIVKGWLEEQRRRDDRLLARLGDEAQAQVKGLEGDARHRKVLELHAGAILERALEKAARQGLVSEEEATRLRALPPEDAIKAVRGLHRKMILFVHRDEIDAAERARLEKLPDSAFFRDRRVKRLRFGPQLSRPQLRSLESLNEEQRRSFIAALSAPAQEGAVEKLDFLPAELRKVLGEMKPESRSRFARMAKRMLFRNRHLYRPQRRLFSKLPEAERRQFMELEDDARRFAFLEKRFPEEDWASARVSWAAREEVRGLLGRKMYLMRGIERTEPAALEKRLREAGLADAAVARILELRPQLEKQERGGRRGARGMRDGRGRGSRDGRGGERGRRMVDSLMKKLNAEERQELEAITDPRERMNWLRKKFPESFSGRRGPGPKGPPGRK